MLHLEGRNPAKFRFSDGLSETVVVLQPDDDSETLAAKLQRVLELEASQGLPIRQPGAAPSAAKAEFDPLIDVAAAEAAMQAQPVGWGSQSVEELPEA
jgi:hypothetical protein